MRARNRAFILLALLLAASPLTAQGPWTRVPPLPTACYSGQDTFERDAETVRTELEGIIEKQEQINRGIVDQVFSMDPATLQQRMMAAVQKNPARAQEIMQAMQSVGTGERQGAGAAAEAEENEFGARKAKLIADYKAEKGRVMSLYATPAPAEQETVTGHQRQTDPAVLAENNLKYRTVLCPKWFGKEVATVPADGKVVGVVPALLASYRTYLMEQRIPNRTAAEVEGTRMPEMLGVSTKDFRPIAEMRAVVDYLRFAIELFGLRESEPLKN